MPLWTNVSIYLSRTVSIYLSAIGTIEAAGINGNYSLKPTMFGLLIDKKTCFEYMRELTAEAASHGNFIRIDMEDSSCVDDSIDIFRQLKQEFPQNIGLAIQAYLKRTLGDLESMLDLRRDDAVLNFRLVKGVYVEPAAIAYKDYHEINAHFLEDLEFMGKIKQIGKNPHRIYQKILNLKLFL